MQAWIVESARCVIYRMPDGPYEVIEKKGQWVKLDGHAKKIMNSRLVYSKTEAINYAIEHHKSMVDYHRKKIDLLDSMR